MTLEAGKKEAFNNETKASKNFYEVIITEDSSTFKDGVQIQMEIGRINKDGSREILSKPTVHTKVGEKVQITSAPANKEQIMLEMTATKK